MTIDNDTIREIRINPIVSSESVVIATARGKRPRSEEKKIDRVKAAHDNSCPFCSGNESLTPPTIIAKPDIQNWQIRIIENLYPVLADDNNESSFNISLQQAIEGYGRHEVIIDHNDHGIAIHEMSINHLQMLFREYCQRMLQLYQYDFIRYVLLFKNFGAAAGASIRHTHSQIIAMPVIPENVHNELVHSRDYYNKHHHCIFCALIDEALTFEATIYDRESGKLRRQIDIGDYIVERGKKFIAIKPFASRYEWEVHILPLKHESDFVNTNDEDLEDLARVLKNTMQRLDHVIGGAQYNYFVHSQPRNDTDQGYDTSYHWHLEICPRTSIPSGFELGSGLFVNTISPEDAAEQLRNVAIDS